MATRPISIKIIGDDSNLRKSLKGASRKLEGFGKSVARFGGQAGIAFAATAAAVATKGVTAFADFEKGMKEVMTLLPDAGEEAFGELSDQVKDFSKEFGVLPDKAIPSLYSALSAGVPKDNVFEFMEIAQKAAKGGVTELETAVDALSSVVNAYGAEAITATESSDLLLTAVRLGKTTFEELAAEVYKVAPIAASVGVPFENLTASIAVLTSQGVPTAQSATMLKGALAELAKEGTKADKAFREFAGEGLAGFLEGGGTFEEAIMGLAAQADASGKSVLDLFGSVEAGQAILSLTSDGGAAFSSVLGEMGNSAGATQAAFETMDSGLSANFDRIKANLAVLAIDIGEKLAPHVARATDFLVDLFDRLGPFIEKAKVAVQEWGAVFIEKITPAVERFVEVAKRVIDWVRTFIKENPKAALAALGVIVASVVIPAVLGLVAAFAALFSPVIFIVAALAALAAGAVYAYEHFEGFRNVVDTVRDWMVNTLWPALKWVAEKIVEGFQAMVSYFQTDFLTHVQAVVDAIKVAWQAVADFFMTYLWPTIRLVLGYITDGFKALVTYFQTNFLNHVQVVASALVTAWQTVATFFMTYLWPAIRLVLGYIVAGFSALVTYFQTNFLNHVQAVGNGLIAVFQAVWDFIEESFIPFLETAAATITTIFTTLADFFTTYVWPIIKAAFEGIRSVIQRFWDVVKSMVSLVKALFAGDFKQVWFKLRDLIVGVLQLVVDLFIALPMKIWEASKPLVGKFALIVSDFTVHLFHKILDLIQSIPDQIVEFMSGIATDILNIGKDIGGWIIDGLIAAIKAAAGAVGDAVKSIIPDVGGMVGGALDLGKGALSAIGGIFGATGGIVTRPTLAVIGEAGPEAVIPLSRTPGSSPLPGGTTFNITVHAGMGTDGHQVGNQIVSALKQWERANGSLR